MPNSNGWPLQTGQDFLPDHQVSGIDYASVHLWPDNWDRTDLDFGKSWINNHRLQAQSYLKMPLVIEEFGKGVGEALCSSLARSGAGVCMAWRSKPTEAAKPSCVLLACCTARAHLSVELNAEVCSAPHLPGIGLKGAPPGLLPRFVNCQHFWS